MLRVASSSTWRASARALSPRTSVLRVTPTRLFADKPSINDPNPPVLPGTQSKTIPRPVPPPPGPVTSAPAANPTSSSTTLPTTQNVPLTPPPPPPPGSGGSSSASNTSSIQKKKPRRLGRYLFYLLVLTGLSFSGGVWYSMVSDNFHDFFTEYIPFGEEAVLYFEEREFRKRFPRVLSQPSRNREPAPQVTIPGKSGLSWKVAGADGESVGTNGKGPHTNAVGANDRSPASAATSGSSGVPSSRNQSSAAPTASSKSAKPEAVDSEPGKRQTPEKVSGAVTEKPSIVARPSRTNASEGGQNLPEVNEPSIYIPLSRIDPFKIPNANEPVVQDLVKVFNDVILVLNAENKSSRMATSIEKAKAELSKVGQRIIDMKTTEQNSANAKLKSTETEFENAARELVRRVEGEIQELEGRWRDEFETERQKLSNSYEERLASEIKRIGEIADQATRNQLLEQSIALKKKFASDVKDRVETERNGRLAKLSELSSSVEELERLASAWNAVIDTNLQTQHLQVAVEAVRANIERSEQRPFIKELAALKEIAADDAVISSAIASINPTAYQRGIPTSAQLIDRFRSVADEVRKASLLPDDAGVASHAASFLVSKVLFKKQGRAVGDDVESVLTRTETLLEEGNFDEAAREMNGLTGWAKTLSGDWLTELRRVLEVRQALDIISTEARLQSLKVD